MLLLRTEEDHFGVPFHGIWSAATARAEARRQLQRSEVLSREVGNLWFELFARTEMLWLTALEGRPLDASTALAGVLSAWHRAGDWANQWLSLRHVFGICFLIGADELAVLIHGALERAAAVDAFPVRAVGGRRPEEDGRRAPSTPG